MNLYTFLTKKYGKKFFEFFFSLKDSLKLVTKAPAYLE